MDPRIPVSSMASLQQQQVQMQYVNPYGVASLPITQHQPMPAYLTDPTSMHRLNPALYGNSVSSAQYQLPQLSHLPQSSCAYSMPAQVVSTPAFSYATVSMGGTNTTTLSTDCSQTGQVSQNAVNQVMQLNQVQNNAGQRGNQVQQSTSVNANGDNIVPNSMQLSTVNTNDIQTESLPNSTVGMLDKVTEPSAIGIKEELDSVGMGQDAGDYDADTDIDDNMAGKDCAVANNDKDANVSWPYMCILCNETFTLKKQLQKHKMMPCKKVLYIKNRCDFCRRNFTRSDHVSRHIKTVHANKFKMWQGLQMKRRELRARQTKKGRMREEMRTRTCQYCLRVFRSIEEKDIHVRHHVGEVMPYLCTLCQCKFAEESQLKLHRRTRCGKNAFKCTMCDFAAISSNVIKRHEMLHTGEKPYKCETCNKGFMTKAALKCHRYTHTGEKPFACTDCNKAFTTQEHLKRHRMIHTGEKPFKCSHCDATFNQKNTLRAHEIVHETSKPYICQECGITFASLSNLRTHLRTHGGEKNYTCKYCNRQFGRTDTLAKHERTHTGEKPFVCRYCGQAYSRADKLHKHEKIHEGGPATSTPKKKAKQADQEATGAAEEQTGYPPTSDIMAYAYRLACDYSNQEDNPVLNPTGAASLASDMPPMYVEEDVEKNEKRHQFVKEYCKAVDDTFKTPDATVATNPVLEVNTLKDSSTALPDPIAQISIKKELQEEAGHHDGISIVHRVQQQMAGNQMNATTSSVGNISINSSMNTSMNQSMNSSVKEELDAYDESTDEGEGPMNTDPLSTFTLKKKKVAHICDICQKKYSSKHAVQRHKKAIHKIGDKPYRCCDCQEDFETQILFEEHQKLHIFACMLCPRSFITEANLKKHQERHKNQKVHVCMTCNKAFVRKDHLQIHEKRHLSGKTLMRHVECQYCCMAFPSKEDALEHERTSHDPHEDKPYLCLICREQFTTMALLITHKYLHKGQKPFNCNQCSRSFRFHSALLAHSKTHNGEKPFKCEQCDDRFTSMAHVKRHMQTHTGEKPYTCAVCDTHFSQGSSLKAHLLRAHPELGDNGAAEISAQSFTCETCGATFKSMANLQTHQRKHLGVKVHECTYCQKKFARSDTLKNHERIHRGEKPFVCSVCSVAFTRKDKMKAHERRHENHPNGMLPVVRKKKIDLGSSLAQVTIATETQATATASSLPTQILSTPASISTPAPLVTATLLPTVSSAASASQQLAAVVTATPLVAAATSAYAAAAMAQPAPAHISSAYQQANPLQQTHHLTHHAHQHLYAAAATSTAPPVFTSGSSVSTTKSMLPPSHAPGPPQHTTTTAASNYPHPHPHYSHTASPHHIYHPSPAPSPHYSPAPSPSPYAPGQVGAAIPPAAAAAMTGYFTEHASQAAAMSYHASPLFTTNPAPPQAYQLTHSSVMHL